MEWDILKNNSNSTLIQRIRWRLKYTKVRRFSLFGATYHCDTCDVRDGLWPPMCMICYCPCTHLESLKLKKQKNEIKKS